MKSRIIKKIFFLVIMASYAQFANGQAGSLLNDSDVRRLNNTSPSVLVDAHTGVKYILDSTRTVVTAINEKGKIIWKTNPAQDNNFNSGFDSNQYIKKFVLAKEKWSLGKEEIYITYSYNTYGFLDKKNGKWKYIGRD